MCISPNSNARNETTCAIYKRKLHHLENNPHLYANRESLAKTIKRLSVPHTLSHKFNNDSNIIFY